MFQNPSQKIKNLGTAECIHPESLKNKRVLMRCDFNVSIDSKGKIKDSIRIEKSFRTINYLKNSGAKIILISHIGRSSDKTLEPVYKYLSKKYKVKFIKDLFSYEAKRESENVFDKEIILFENLRQWSGEVNNDIRFAKKLSEFGDIFVNEAFSVSHREHASIVGIPKYLKSYIGFHFQEEVLNLSKIFNPEHPFLVLIGGAKFETKLKLIESLENNADEIFVGGALANDIFRSQNYQMGQSIVSSLEKEQINRLLISGKIFPPKDVLVLNKYKITQKKLPNKILNTDKIVDAGPKTFKILKKKIKESKIIVWNGPFGWYEEGFNYLTKKVAKEISKSKAFTIVGGGDTLTEIICCRRLNDYDFISTAGGAMLEFISKQTLPGIDAIEEDTI